MNRCTSLLLLALAGACGGSSKPAPAPVTNTSLPAPSCDDAAAGYARVRVEQVAHGEADPDALRPKIASRVVRACVDGAWSVEARSCFADAAEPIAGQPEPPACEDRLTPDQTMSLDGAIGALRAELEASHPTDPDVAAFEAKVAKVKSGIPACDAYLRELVLLQKCELVPHESRVAAIQSGDAMIEAFRSFQSMSGPDVAAARTAAGDGCQAAVDGLKQTRDGMGC